MFFFNKIEIQAIFFIFNTTPGFPHFYYAFGANLGLLLYREVPVMGLFLLPLYGNKQLLQHLFVFVHQKNSFLVT